MIRPHDDSIAKSPLASEAAAPESPHAINTTIPRHSVHLRRSPGRRGAPAGRRRARETAAGLPVVLTRDEVRAVLGRLDGAALMAYLLYGSGLRVLEWSSSASSALLRDKPASPTGPPLTPSATRSPPTSSRTSTTSAHRDLATTQIYTHVLNRGPSGVRSRSMGCPRPDRRHHGRRPGQYEEIVRRDTRQPVVSSFRAVVGGAEQQAAGNAGRLKIRRLPSRATLRHAPAFTATPPVGLFEGRIIVMRMVC
jgi:hypothetical protein